MTDTMPWPTRPNPGTAENGKEPCNEPLKVNGLTVAYCDRWCKTKPKFVGPKKPHRGPHRVEWWSA